MAAAKDMSSDNIVELTIKAAQAVGALENASPTPDGAVRLSCNVVADTAQCNEFSMIFGSSR